MYSLEPVFNHYLLKMLRKPTTNIVTPLGEHERDLLGAFQTLDAIHKIIRMVINLVKTSHFCQQNSNGFHVN